LLSGSSNGSQQPAKGCRWAARNADSKKDVGKRIISIGLLGGEGFMSLIKDQKKTNVSRGWMLRASQLAKKRDVHTSASNVAPEKQNPKAVSVEARGSREGSMRGRQKKKKVPRGVDHTLTRARPTDCCLGKHRIRDQNLPKNKRLISHQRRSWEKSMEQNLRPAIASPSGPESSAAQGSVSLQGAEEEQESELGRLS